MWRGRLLHRFVSQSLGHCIDVSVQECPVPLRLAFLHQILHPGRLRFKIYWHAVFIEIFQSTPGRRKRQPCGASRREIPFLVPLLGQSAGPAEFGSNL